MSDKVREALEAVIHDAFWDLAPKDSAFVLLRIKEALAAIEDDGWVRCSERYPPPHIDCEFRIRFKGRPCYGLHLPLAVHHNSKELWAYREQVQATFTESLEWRELPPTEEGTRE